MQRVVGHAGLPETVTLHALRHTYATLLLDGGADPLWVKQQLGHASIAITVDLYGAGAHGRRPDLLAGLAGIEPAASSRAAGLRHPVPTVGATAPRRRMPWRRREGDQLPGRAWQPRRHMMSTVDFTRLRPLGPASACSPASSRTLTSP